MQKKNEETLKLLNNTKCPVCGYYNKNIFAKKYGKCRRCLTVIDERADFKYNMIIKLHLFKKGQAGFGYSKDIYMR